MVIAAAPEARLATCGLVWPSREKLADYLLYQMRAFPEERLRPFVGVHRVERFSIVGPRRGGLVWRPVAVDGWLCDVGEA